MRSHLQKILTLIALASAICAATLLYLDWRPPRATATIKVNPSLIHSSLDGWFLGYPTNPKITLSKETLSLASKILKIEEEWAKQALPLVNENFEVNHVRGTDFITITAENKNRSRAAKIANATAEAYAQLRTVSEKNRTKRAHESLDEELASQQEEITAYHLELEKSDRAQDPVAHSNKQQAYDLARSTLREMKIIQEEPRSLLNMPRTPVTIHKRAE
ncbi:MAG: hypothetical protein ACJA16_003821 [Akkermansiaceae bacterium]|jgi:hypothetical protein